MGPDYRQTSMRYKPLISIAEIPIIMAAVAAPIAIAGYGLSLFARPMLEQLWQNAVTNSPSILHGMSQLFH